MKKIFNEIKKLDSNQISNAQRVSKLFEECGELAQSVNKTNGMKSSSQSREEIENEILEESADAIQNIISIVADFGFSWKDLKSEISRKNKVWESKIKSKEKQKK
jgi:NTP pyrophosphatase (non-canonical NTP hydrolase)